MSNLALIQPQRADFDTQQTCAWLDLLPVVAQASPGGAVAGSANVGNGVPTIAAVAPGTPFGHLTVQIITASGGLTRFTVVDAAGDQVAQGVVGLPIYAGGVTFTLAQGSTPFAVGDSFALGVLPQPVDLTGLRFDLDVRQSLSAATVALQASTADAVPTLLNGSATGVLAVRLLKPAMIRLPAGTYPYSILAVDPVADPQGLAPVPAFYGLIYHTAVAAQIGQGS